MLAGRSLAEAGLSKKALYRQVRKRIEEAASAPGFFDPIEGLAEYKLYCPGDTVRNAIGDCVQTQFVQMILLKKGVRHDLKYILPTGSLQIDEQSYDASMLPILQHTNQTVVGAIKIAEYIERIFPLKSLTVSGILNYTQVMGRLSNFYPTVTRCITMHEATIDANADSSAGNSQSKNAELLAAVDDELNIFDEILRSTPGQYLCGVDLTLADLYFTPMLFHAVVGIEHFLKSEIFRVKASTAAKRPALEAYMTLMFSKQLFNDKKIYVHADKIVNGWKQKIKLARQSIELEAAEDS